MLYEKEVKETSEEKKKFMKRRIIKEIEHLAVLRRSAHKAGWEYEEIDRWIAEEAPEQFAKFEALDDDEMGAFLSMKVMSSLAEFMAKMEED